jgi:putative polyhydroxyalkanoate system protein
MSRILIRRSHALKPAEARERVAHLARKLGERFGAECRWQGAVLTISHSNVTGTVTLAERDIVVDAELGFALSLFRSRAEQEIARLLDEELSA